ncbi:MAG: PAS domain S-box protein [Candidatus Zixiibacteriota bacterium]|nr:MAG: PAS domain S-box protein [candidate division Zixibacteria bacterium]
MEHERTLNRLGLFVPLRLTSYVILATVVVFWSGRASYLQPATVIYSLLTLALALMLAFQRRFHFSDVVLYTVIGGQFLLELFVESGIVHTTGNVQSSFSPLYVLTIVSAALVYRLIGTLVIASLASVAYTFAIWWELDTARQVSSWGDALEALLSNQSAVFYSIFLHLLIFYLVAFISGYLAERLKRQSDTLAHASRQLRQARLETDDILRHLNSGLLTIDRNGTILYFNRAAERILGYREEQVRGMHCRDVFAERVPELGMLLMEAITRGVTHPRKEIAVVSPDGQGETIPLGLSTSILTDENGAVRGVIAIFSDLTEAKRLEEQVRAADRMAAVGQLSAAMAHEIRNPLAAISGSVQVLRSELTLSGDNRRLMDVIVTETNRLNKLLSNFLVYARVSRPTYSRVELCRVIGDVVELMRHHDAHVRQHQITWSSDEGTMYVSGDEDMLRQLFINLAVNAIEALGEAPGRVEFTVAQSDDGDVIVEVSDSGPGMPPEVRARIFEPFYSTKSRGSGLGLAIVHRVCSTLGIELQVTSEEGRGTTFTLRFPPVAEAAVVPDEATVC